MRNSLKISFSVIELLCVYIPDKLLGLLHVVADQWWSNVPADVEPIVVICFWLTCSQVPHSCAYTDSMQKGLFIWWLSFHWLSENGAREGYKFLWHYHIAVFYVCFWQLDKCQQFFASAMQDIPSYKCWM